MCDQLLHLIVNQHWMPIQGNMVSQLMQLSDWVAILQTEDKINCNTYFPPKTLQTNVSTKRHLEISVAYNQKKLSTKLFLDLYLNNFILVTSINFSLMFTLYDPNWKENTIFPLLH